MNYLDISIDPFFSAQELDQLAREAQFVRREGKLNGSLFFDLIVFHNENLKAQSLNDMAFLKQALEKLLHQQLELDSAIFSDLKGFNRILLKDSTSFQIDASLAQYYAGSGGHGSDASIRIQFEYDIVSGRINDLSVTAFNRQDAKDSLATIELIDPGDLIIRDLSYMGLEVLKAIRIKEAFYLCRAHPTVHILQKHQDEYK